MQRQRFFFSPLRTLVCAATLLGMGLPAWSASWFPLGVYGDAASYFDTGSVQTSGQIRKVWTMLDYRKPQYNRANMKFMSTRAMMEIDCARHMARPRSSSYHTQGMLGGQVISSEGIFSDWQPIAPSTPLGAIFSQVCKPKDEG